MVQHNTANVHAMSVFYREAGTPGFPKLVLLGGFPASSHQFRNFLPALADRFHVISPDYPGFGNSDMPDPSTFPYTFDRLAEVVEGLFTQLAFDHFGLFMQDYGGPVGFRILSRHPELAEGLVLPNTHAHEKGFAARRGGARPALWECDGAITAGPLLPVRSLC